MDSQIYISEVKARPLIAEHKDNRSALGRRYSEATLLSKPQMAANMIKRAVRSGIEADYVIAGAWFGTRSMMRIAVGQGMCAILRMKKSKLKFRAVIKGRKKEFLNAQELYTCAVKREWKKVHGLLWKAVSLDVELDLSENEEKTPRWKEVRLLFVLGLKESVEANAGKKDWALFLSTDVQLSMRKMQEIHALRWGIEVYFKEAKQHLGFLKEQTATFPSHMASMHSCAIRYLMLMHNKLTGHESRIGDIYSTMQEQLDTLSFSGRLWLIFRSIISGALHDLRKRLGCSKQTIIEMIDERVAIFFVRSLQLDALTLRLKYM